MKKLLCIDVDGTLVHGEYKITDEIKNQFKTMNSNFIIVSGRTVEELLQLESGFDLIGSNGGEIFKDNQFIQKASVSKEEAVKIIDDMAKFGYYSIVHTDVGIFIQTDSDTQVCEELHKILQNNGTLPEHYDDRHAFMFNHVYGKSIKVDDLKQYVIDNELHINKLESHFELDKEHIFKHLSENYDVEAFNSAGSNIEIVPNGALKGDAIKKYIGKDNYYIIAIGDGNNDIPMFEVADYKIAMGNGTDNLKKLADKIVSPGHDGFIEALKLTDSLDIN